MGRGFYQLKTQSGIRGIQLPWLIDQFGPAEIYRDNCSSLLFLQPGIHWAWIIPTILMALILLLLPFLLRFKMLKRKLREYGYKGSLTISGLKVVGPMGARRVSFFRILIYCYLFKDFVVQGCIQRENIIGNSSLFWFDASPGDTLCTKAGHYGIIEDMIRSRLIFDYNTSEWTHERSATWGCASGSCPSTSQCEELRLKRLKKSRSGIIKPFCTNYPKGCAFGRGCWFGEDHISFGKSMSVYRIAMDGFRESAYLKDSNCQLKVLNTFSLDYVKLAVVKSDTGDYLCNEVSPRGDPTKGMIGDVQMLGEDIIFDWESVVCDSDWFSSSSCRVLRNQRLEEACKRLPTVVGSLSFSIHDRQVKISQSIGRMSIIGQCQENFVFSQNECFETSFAIIGSRNSGFELTLSAKSHSLNSSSSMEMLLNCSRQIKLNFACDGRYHFFPVEDDFGCNGVEDLTKTTKNFGLTSVLSGDDHPILMFKLHDKNYAFMSSGLLIFVIIIIIVLGCCHN